METTIAVAGATGNLGRLIVNALLDRGAHVRALVRTGTSHDRLAKLERAGVSIAQVNMASVSELTRACTGASCVVSALQGLRDVIIDAQSTLLDAAIAAGVPVRFIPSDFSIDFGRLPAGENRNFDLRREFHERLDHSPIAATSILNGAFAELLTSRMPLLDFEAKRVSYWENADQRMDFTTMDDTATFTADAALDPSVPTVLRPIAGDQKGAARELAAVAGDVTKAKFELVRLGSPGDLPQSSAESVLQIPKARKSFFPTGQACSTCTACSAAAPNSNRSTTLATRISGGRAHAK